jgi:hypothetical protein
VKERVIIIFILSSAVLYGCGLTTETQGSPTLSAPVKIAPTRTAAPSPTPLPDTSFSSINLVPGESKDDWIVLGFLENRSEIHIADVQIKILLQDDQGITIGEKRISPLLPHIAPGERSPFSASFLALGNKPTVDVEIDSVLEADFLDAEIDLEIISKIPTDGGDTAVLSRVQNPNPFPVNIDGLGLAALNAEGELVAVTQHALSLSQLNPGEGSPVLIMLELAMNDFELISYVGASKTTPGIASNKLTLSTPRLMFTQQGIPFVVGKVRNDGSQPLHAVLILTIEVDGEILSVGEVVLPAPLEIGDTVAYSTDDFPGLMAQLRRRSSPLEELTVRVLLDRRRSTPSILQPTTLDVEIHLFEPIGSSIVLRGTVANPTDREVEQAVVMVAVHSTGGELLSAGWVIAEELLTPEAVSQFILPLNFPEDWDPALNEYDIQAVGFTR